MAGQHHHHHLGHSLLDPAKPRVPPVLYPSLDAGDVMVAPHDPLYAPHHQRRPLSPSSALNTSFTDLMLGDRPLKSREGRLARCGVESTHTSLHHHRHHHDPLHHLHHYSSLDTNTTQRGEDTTLTTDGADLRDTIVALRLQNAELSLCLEQERRRRQEAENTMERERGYIKRLEESVQVSTYYTYRYM